MTLRKWDPLRDLLTLQERMNRLFEESLVRLGQPLLANGTWTPAADIYDAVEGYVVLLELPGVEPDDLGVEVRADRLTVRGVRGVGRPTRPDCFHRMERSYGAFARVFHFPDEVDPARFTARLEDGVLQVEVPKARARSGRRAGGGRSPAPLGRGGG